MKPYPIELRERVAEAIDSHEGSFRQIAERFKVSVSFITRLLAHRRVTGSLRPHPHGGGRAPAVDAQAMQRIGEYLRQCCDATLAEIKAHVGLTCSEAALCRALLKANITRKKKTNRACERDAPRIQAQRQQFQDDVAEVSPEQRVYVDETAATTDVQRRYGRSKRGTRAYGCAPGSWKTLTTISALRLDGIATSLAFPGATDQQAFRPFVKECLVPVLRPGDVVIWDNLKAHKDAVVARWIQEAGCRMLPLPPYSPDFSPIEEMFSKVKEKLRSLAARTVETLYQAIGDALNSVTLQDIRGWFSHRGLCAIQP